MTDAYQGMVSAIYFELRVIYILDMIVFCRRVVIGALRANTIHSKMLRYEKFLGRLPRERHSRSSKGNARLLPGSVPTEMKKWELNRMKEEDKKELKEWIPKCLETATNRRQWWILFSIVG
jgi:hypothetical protein